MINNSILFNTDSYKVGMTVGGQYPEGTEYVYSYIESRGGPYDYTLFFGLQAYLKEYLEGVRVTKKDIDKAERMWIAHGEPFDRTMWDYIVDVHGGKLPVKIVAAKEGLRIPVKNILAYVVNTDPKCAQLTTWLETSILRAIWYPTTVATQSSKIKSIIKEFMLTTCDSLDGLEFKLHDFGARGVSSFESGSLGAMAHLVPFRGTDTFIGNLAAELYYDKQDMAGFSIFASEHSTMTFCGREGETDQFRRMIRTAKSKNMPIFACVSDGYSILDAAEKWGTVLKQDVVDSGARLVVRPDSGDPVKVTLEVLRSLEKNFGAVRNKKGFKVINNAGVIYGDGINELTIESILRTMEMNRYSTDNIAFGMGGALLQGITRDTQKFAMKCSAGCVDGVWRDVFKDPITDQGKKSKKGRMSLFKSRLTGEFATFRVDQGPIDSEWEDQMQVVFENGELTNVMAFDEVRTNSEL